MNLATMNSIRTIAVTLILLKFGLVNLSGQAMHSGGNEEKIYLGLLSGYGFTSGSASDNLGTDPSASDLTVVSTGSPPNSSQAVSGTTRPFDLGKGINIGIYVGYMFTKHIGAELDLSYLIGSTFRKSYTEISNNIQTFQDKESLTGRMLRIMPCIRMQMDESKFHGYMKIGLIMGVLANVNSESQEGTFDIIGSYSGRISWGIHGGIGLIYDLTNTLGIYAEFTENVQSWAPSKMELTKFTDGGVDKLNTLSVSQKQGIYQSGYSNILVTQNGQTVAPDSPGINTKIFFPFSSAGITIGIHVKIGKKFIMDKAKYNLN